MRGLWFLKRAGRLLIIVVLPFNTLLLFRQIRTMRLRLIGYLHEMSPLMLDRNVPLNWLYYPHVHKNRQSEICS